MRTTVSSKLCFSSACVVTWVGSLGWDDPLEEGQPPTSVFLPGESHRQRSLTDYSPRDCKELDMTEQLTLSLFSACGSSLYLGQEQCQRGRSRTEPGADCRVAGPPEQSGSFQSAAFILGLGAASVCVHS